MMLKMWQFVTILLMSLAMASAFCHLLELPPKMTFDDRLYVMLHRTLYPNYGRVAGTAEFLAVMAVAGLAWRVRRARGVFIPTLAGAILMVAAHAVFWIVVQPANSTMAAWSLEAIPVDWTEWRNQWEYGHAARAVLMISALGLLVISVLRDRSDVRL